MLYPARWKKITVDQSKVLKNWLFWVFWPPGITQFFKPLQLFAHFMIGVQNIVILLISFQFVQWLPTKIFHSLLIMSRVDIDSITCTCIYITFGALPYYRILLYFLYFEIFIIKNCVFCEIPCLSIFFPNSVNNFLIFVLHKTGDFSWYHYTS